MRLIDADIFAEISKNFIPEVIEDTFDEGYIACLKAVDLTPTVEAIPAKWISQYVLLHFSAGEEMYSIEFWKMIDKWRKENETN